MYGVNMMKAFLCTFRPRSVQAKDKSKKAAYYKNIIDDYKKYHGNIKPTKDKLYGTIYYFHKNKTDLDADNISKPIWDALNGLAYEDDAQIRFRSSGLFHVGSEELQELDFTDMPDNVANDFIDMIDEGKIHILYIEFGEFSYNQFQFSIN